MLEFHLRILSGISPFGVAFLLFILLFIFYCFIRKIIGCFFYFLVALTLFRMGFFGAAHRWEGGLPKICHKRPTMMKLGTIIPYLKKIQKIYQSRDTPLEFCWHQHYFTGNQQIFLYQEIQIYTAFCYIISNFNFSRASKDCFNKHRDNFDDVRENGHLRPSS